MSFTKSVLFVVTLTLIATLLGGLYAHLNNRGWFEPWQPLGQPPEKAVKIYAHKEGLPFIETSDGEIYLCSNSVARYELNRESCWIKTNRSQIELAGSHPCWEEERFDVPAPPGNIIDMVEFERCEGGIWEFNVQYNFALLEDGSVWSWRYLHTAPVFALFSIILGMGTGAFLGVLIGIIIAIFIALVAMVLRYFKGRKNEAT